MHRSLQNPTRNFVHSEVCKYLATILGRRVIIVATVKSLLASQFNEWLSHLIEKNTGTTWFQLNTQTCKNSSSLRKTGFSTLSPHIPAADYLYTLTDWTSAM